MITEHNPEQTSSEKERKLIVMYHNVAESAGFGTVSIKDLERQLLWAKIHTVVTLNEYIRSIDAGEDSRQFLTITFDDAYMSFVEQALPLLEKHQTPATLFVPVDHIGGTNVWDAHVTENRFRILDKYNLRTISGHELVSIGSHGMTHQSMGTLAPAEAKKEIIQSKSFLENMLGMPIHHFSYPYGQMRDIPVRHNELFADAGYRSACSTRYGRNNKPADRFCLRRIEVTPVDGIPGFIRKCVRRNVVIEIKQFIKDITRR